MKTTILSDIATWNPMEFRFPAGSQKIFGVAAKPSAIVQLNKDQEPMAVCGPGWTPDDIEMDWGIVRAG